MMARQCWNYRQDVPIMGVTYELPDGSGVVTRVLEVDTGAIGGDIAFSIGQGDGNALQVSPAFPVLIQDVSGNVVTRSVVEVIVNMPALNLREHVLAICYPQAPGNHDGLVRLPFLTHYFDHWGGEKDAVANWQFCVER
jgi:hypothetical protein